MKEELIKYVMGKANECYSDDFPIHNIEVWIKEFFDHFQPERSKREDSSNQSLTNSQYEQFIKDTNEYLRCGALNTTETP